jgi:pyruvate kinase
MQRRTKIVATLGPASDDAKVLARMIDAGLDVARLNFSHGDSDEHRRRFELLTKTAAECGRNVGVMGDLQGPKIRIKRFVNGSVVLADGDRFFLDSSLGLLDGNQEGVGVALKSMHEDVGPGDILLLNDGMITLEVDRVEGTRIHTIVINGGILSDHKGINRQGGGLSADALTATDRDNIKLAAELGMDFLAVSFVRNAADVIEARRLFDVIMVARGDLGVEMGYARLIGIQKTLIQTTRDKNKIVITATQMMESMIQNPIPTRAEVSDVANAVIDGTDAVMLSGETAVGAYPVEAIKAMGQVCIGAELFPHPSGRRGHRVGDHFALVDEAIAMAVMYTANHMSVKAIIALTESGSTTRWMSRVRSDIPIYALTPYKATRRRVALYRGVYSVEFEIQAAERSRLYADIFEVLLSNELVEIGDLVIFTKGDLEGVSGNTNAMKILKVAAAE